GSSGHVPPLQSGNCSLKAQLGMTVAESYGLSASSISLYFNRHLRSKVSILLVRGFVLFLSFKDLGICCGSK
ncbi:hypothetical protein STEG23_037441, partial [Scotinomys teguina]